MSEKINNAIKTEFKINEAISSKNKGFIKNTLEQLNKLFPEAWRDDFSGDSHELNVSFKLNNNNIVIQLGSGEKPPQIPISLNEKRTYSLQTYKTNEVVFPLQVVFTMLSKITSNIDFPKSLKAQILIEQCLYQEEPDDVDSDDWEFTD